MAQPNLSQTDQALAAGLSEHRSGRLAEAKAFYKEALEIFPEDPNALNLLGLLTVQMGDGATGIPLLRRSVQLFPGTVEYSINLANSLKNLGRPDEAIDCLRRIIEIVPNAGAALADLADAIRDKKDFHTAVVLYRRALDSGADKLTILGKLSNVLINISQVEEAEDCFRQALEINPSHVPSLNNYGLLLIVMGQVDQAVDYHCRAVEVLPGSADLWYNLGNAYKARNSLSDAREAYTRAIDIDPNLAEAHLHTGFTRLLEGDFSRGWSDYEWRWRARGFPTPITQGERWKGQPPNGAVILLTAEQGLGDTLQFGRYASLVAARGGRVTLQAPPSLCRLMKTVPGVERVVEPGEPTGAYRWHAPLMSLPHIFGTTHETIPAQIPYLTPPEDLNRSWRKRLGREHGLKVGIVWRGFALHSNDRNRSCSANLFRLITSVPNVQSFSLQKDASAEEIAHLDGIEDLASDFDDFGDSAAAFNNLDLIITVDTAAAHLAGALGKPVWVLLPNSPDWRWQLDRDDSPWYPTMRLFRQTNRGNWEEVLERVLSALVELAK